MSECQRNVCPDRERLCSAVLFNATEEALIVSLFLIYAKNATYYLYVNRNTVTFVVLFDNNYLTAF